MQALHTDGKGLTNEDHTIQLLNCYTKLKNTKELDEFILKGKSCNSFNRKVLLEIRSFKIRSWSIWRSWSDCRSFLEWSELKMIFYQRLFCEITISFLNTKNCQRFFSWRLKCSASYLPGSQLRKQCLHRVGTVHLPTIFLTSKNLF